MPTLKTLCFSSVLFVTSIAVPARADAPSTVTFDIYAHVQDYGQITGNEDQWIGALGEGRRLESIAIDPISDPAGSWPSCLSLKYMAHVQGSGDTGWQTAPAVVGTEGKSLRIEGLAFRTSGTCGSSYTVEYRCHLQDLGTSALMHDGEFCGTRGQGRRLEAVKLTIRSK